MHNIEITVKDEMLHLLSQCAVYWPRTGTLFIADMHLTDDSAVMDLLRLSGALTQTGAQQLIVLGDMVDPQNGYTETVRRLFIRWRPPEVKITLVRGDAEQHHGAPPQSWQVGCVDGPTPGPLFVLQHTPQPLQDAEAFSLAGQLHPAREANDGTMQSCFVLRSNMLILPAFADFLVLRKHEAQPDDRIHTIAGDSVVLIV